MTFSLVARDSTTGSFGMVVASSSPAVASRCVHVRAGVGAVASQNVTNPQLGSLILDSLGFLDAEAALRDALSRELHPSFRQLSVVDNAGATAHHSGSNSLGITRHVEQHGSVAAGNLLASPVVIDALMAGYQDSKHERFEGRLLDGLAAALAAGGEAGPVRSAGIQVVDDVAWPTTDLRVDDSDAPVQDLERLWVLWEPQKDAYRLRALDPCAAPSYGVPGGE